MILENVSLLPFNTFRIDVKARNYAVFQTIEELKEILRDHPNEPRLILGGGSNILFTKDFDGLVLKNEFKGIEIVQEDDTHVWVKAAAGENWHEFVLYCVDHNWGGIENLSLIPGTVGASPMQNIGAYGVEIKDVFEELEALRISDLQLEKFDKETCHFGYRESIFKHSHKNGYVITSVTYRLSKKDHKLKTGYGAIQDELQQMGVKEPTIKDISTAVIAIRRSKLPDPKEIGNAGSFFKNPVVPISVLQEILKKYEQVPNYPAGEGSVKMAAGWLIEQAGWKGFREGDHGVHAKQALVLVNLGSAKGKDILELSSAIIADIQHKFNVTLEREVNLL